MSASSPQASKAADLDHEALAAYLPQAVDGTDGALNVARISGGQSNPTFFVDAGRRRLVLRKQPAGEHLPSAHQVDREFRVMKALAGSDVPVPEMVKLEEDRSVLGTAFYVMERLDGRVIHDSRLPDMAREDRVKAYAHVARTLGRLHAVDWRAAGLEGFGRPGNFFERQTGRWTKQWHLSKTREIPELDRLVDWLPKHVPADDRTTIVHGDYRIGNLMFHPTEPRIVGVLDWELSTLGHPLADLAHAGALWHVKPEEYGGLMGVDLAAQGLPELPAFEEEYLAAAGSTERLTPFHLAFALFRFAVIFEGIAARAASGTASAANAAEVGKLSSVLARRAEDILSSDKTYPAS